MAKVSLEKDKIKFLLVEGVHQKALESLRAAGYTNIEFHKGALDDEQLKESIRDAHFIGLRSRTHQRRRKTGRYWLFLYRNKPG